MATKKKMTNQEALAQIAEMSATEAATYGATPDLQQTAAMAAAGDVPAMMSLTATDTPLYNAMLGILVKLAYTPLRYADYTDLYAAHHRNFVQGKPERNFIGLAKVGTGNNAQLETDAATGNGMLTTVVTATTPDIYSVTVTQSRNFVARVPISDADYRNAFNNEYGITNLIQGIRKSLENKIINDRNNLFDTAFSDAVDTAVKVGTGAETTENLTKATIVDIGEVVSDPNELAQGVEREARAIYQGLSRIYFEMTGRPTEKYNALGVPNNTPEDAMIVYIDPKYYSAMRTYVDAFAFNSEALTIKPMKFKPMSAPWMGKFASGSVGGNVIAAIGSVDWALDYPVNDFSRVVPTDRGEIVARFLDTELSIAGFEQMCFIVYDK